MNWPTIADFTVGLLVLLLVASVGAQGRCDGGGAECAPLAPGVGAPPPLSGPGGANAVILPSSGSSANAGSKSGDRHDISNVSASSVVRAETPGSTVPGTLVPENTDQPQVEDKHYPQDLVTSEELKKQEIISDSLKEKEEVHSKSEDKVLKNENIKKREPIPTLQTTEGSIITKDFNVPSGHSSLSRSLDLPYQKFNVPNSKQAPDLDSPSAGLPFGTASTESAYVSTSSESKDTANINLKVKHKDLEPTKEVEDTQIKSIYSLTQNASKQEDSDVQSGHAKEESHKQLEDLEHRQQEDNSYDATAHVVSVEHQIPGMKVNVEDTTKESVSPVSKIVPLPTGLIRSQVSESVNPHFKDTLLSQSAQTRQNGQVPSGLSLNNQKSATNDSISGAKNSHRLDSINVIQQEVVDTAQGFIPAANEVKTTSVGHSQDVTSDKGFSPTAVADGAPSSSKAGYLVDQVHQKLEDPTPGPAPVTGESNLFSTNGNPSVAPPGVEPAPRTLLQSQVVDPVHQELEETTPATLVKTATTNPPSSGNPAATGASKVAFEFTNHVSVTYNETGDGSPADNIRKDLLVENGSRMAYATAFVHSVQLDDDDEEDDEHQISTTAAGSRMGTRKAALQNTVMRQEEHSSPESADDGRPGIINSRVNNSFSNDAKLKELQQQLHALKSDGVSTQPPINTLKPTLEKDFAAMKDLRIGIIQLETSAEPLVPNKYTDTTSTQSSHSHTSGKENVKVLASNMPEPIASESPVESRLSEDSSETGVLIINAEAKQIPVSTSTIPTTLKDKSLGKDEEFKFKTKPSADFASRNKKLTTGSSSNHSDLWTRILPMSSMKPQLLNTTDEIDKMRNGEEEQYETAAAEKLPKFNNDSQFLLMGMRRHSNSSDTEMYEGKEMIPVPISTVVPSTVINHRHERVDSIKAETVVQKQNVQKEADYVSNTSRTSPNITPLQIKDKQCKTDENCNESQDIGGDLDLTLLSTPDTKSESFTTTIIYTNGITEVSTEEELVTENIEIKFTTLSSLVEKSNATGTSSIIYTGAVPTTTTLSTVPFTSDQFLTVPAVDNQSSNDNEYSSTEEPQDIHTGTEFYSTTIVPLSNVKAEGSVFSTVVAEEEHATQTDQTIPPSEVVSTTKSEGSQWFYGDQPQGSSNNIGWQEATSTKITDNKLLTTTINLPEPTTEQVPDKDVSEWDIPDKSETVTAFCRLTVLASGEQVCLYLGGLPSNIAELLQQYSGRVIMYQQVVIHMPGKEVRCDDITRERTLDVYIQDENGSFDYDLSVLLKKIWDETHPKLPLNIINLELVKEDGNDTTNAPSDPGLEPDPNGEITPGLLAAIIVACIGTVSLLLLFGLMVYVRRRQKRFNYGQRCTPVSLDAYSVDSISVYDSVRSRRKGVFRTSKRSYGNLAFDDPNSPSHPMNFAGLANFSSDMEALQEEFEAVPQIAVTTDDLPVGADVKNRYSNVIPLPETRVPLTPKEGEPLSDYINANYVRGPNNEEKFYIACQAPLQSTITDFWRMVWEQQTKVILMVCNLVEDGSEKCADYLPPSEVLDCHRLFGDFQITLKKREEKERYVISTLQIKNLESNLWREVIHIWFASWPDKGVPDDPSPLIAFLIESRSHMRNATGPHVVHCSPGTGRTGTVISCDILIREFERTRTVDVPRCVYRLRRDRAGAVKTKEQYVFIYKVLNHYAAMLTGGALDSI